MVEESKVVETRQAAQKEVALTMTTGKFAKNEVSIKYMGLRNEDEVGVKEITDLLLELERKNPVKAKEEMV